MDATTFRSIMSSYPTGVTIVTATDGGDLHGMTANSFTSVSLEPPLVLVCAQRDSRTGAAARHSGRLAIHVLAHDQGPAALAFVGRDAPRFAAVAHDLDDAGVPILRERLALLVCEVERVVDAGDHEILIGLVIHCERVSEDVAPLVFHDRQLRRLPLLAGLRAPESRAEIGGDLRLEDHDPLGIAA